MNFRPYILPVAALLSFGPLAACTNETAAEVDRAPTVILTDADRQAAYNLGRGSGAVPDATPGRVPAVRQDAAGTGARQHIGVGSVNNNEPSNLTPEERMRRLQGNPQMLDTLRRP